MKKQATLKKTLLVYDLSLSAFFHSQGQTRTQSAEECERGTPFTFMALGSARTACARLSLNTETSSISRWTTHASKEALNKTVCS